MALDHYVSQVHLRQFLSPALAGRRLFAFRKSNGDRFAAPTKSLCRIDEGSTNPFLTEPRVVEDFLKTVEPHYNSAIDELRAGRHSQESIWVVAGFAAYVGSCSPAAMRINSEMPRLAVESTAAIMDARGALPRAPEVLGGASLSELIESGQVTINIEPKYPQALGVVNIIRAAEMLGGFEWEVLHNEGSGSPFLTSDFPSAIEQWDPGGIKRIVPLAPDLAVRIIARRQRQRRGAERKRHRKVDRSGVLVLNRAIVRCAEDFVFSREDAPWVVSLVRRNRRYRVAPISARVPTETGGFVLSTAVGVLEGEPEERGAG